MPSQPKKVKLSAEHPETQDSIDSPDIPLTSVEGRDSQTPPVDLPRPGNPTNSAIPPHLHASSSFGGADYISSAASSPSAAYANLTLDGERGGDRTSPEVRRTSLAPTEIDTRGHSPRSSSPLKRRASDDPETEDLDVSSSQNDDVDMIMVPSDHEESAEKPNEPTQPRSKSVDMTEEESKPAQAATAQEQNNESTAPVLTAETAIPSIDIQIQTVTTLCQAASEVKVQEGDVIYLVSKRWLGRVIARGSNSKEIPEGEIGPIDNSDIIQQIIMDCDGVQFAQLKAEASQTDYEYFPTEAWDLVLEWYGLMPGSVPIKRIAHNTQPDKTNGLPQVEYELNPTIFTVHRLFADNNPITINQKLKVTNPPAPIFIFSKSTRYHTFLTKLKQKAGIDLKKKVRVWQILPEQQQLATEEPIRPAGAGATPPSSRPGSPTSTDFIGPKPREVKDSWTHLFLDLLAFAKVDRVNGRALVGFEDTTGNEKYNGKMDLQFVGLGFDQTLVLDEYISGDSYVSNYTTIGNKSTSAALVRTAGTSSLNNSGRNSPAPSGPMTRGRAQKNGRTLGTCGLTNLGNTCYMNSALQCVRSVEELTKYFLVGAAKQELNPENPLGNNGEVASTYEKLLEEIYKDTSPSSVAPRYFKSTISKYAPTFAGYGQQDSQEFVGFLLDGLQEDLSRVKKKPYIEKPDSTDDMVNNPEAIKEMAAKVWDITKKRDDSVIADLFTGMYKSTLVCPVCDKVSITFDPFNNLTLQLPVESAWSHEIVYFPLNDKPVKLLVDVDKHGSILSLKQFISKRVGVPVGRLFAAEEFKYKFYRVFDDNVLLNGNVTANDHVVVYELETEPTNWPPPKKAKKPKAKKSFNLNFNQDSSDEDDVPSWDSPLAEKMLVPVFHRYPNNDRPTSRYAKLRPWNVGAAPHFIVLTAEEARDHEIIKRKILEKMMTLSTYREFLDDDETDPDIVLTTGSDADSAGGTKVVANSIDGEDELVDVTMKDSNGTQETLAKIEPSSMPPSSSLLRSFNQVRPKFMTPGSHLNPSLQNMFEIGYFPSIKEIIPSGWSAVDDDKEYTSISTRLPRVNECQDDEVLLDEYEVPNMRSGSESSEGGDPFQTGFEAATRMNDEESSDEDSIPAVPRKVLPVRSALPSNSFHRGGSHKMRKGGMKTYSKKGINRPQQRKLQQVAIPEQDTSDEGPLVRLGEGLVVDWSTEAWEVLFGADSEQDTMRGSSNLIRFETLYDPELQTRRNARIKRRKNGITLDDCLDEFGKEEILSEMDTWYCPRCKEHRRASKKLELWKTPDILIMHLKRFSSSGTRRDKLDIFVDFPIDGLDLTTRVTETEDGKQEIYDLFAVDDHWGGLGGGHYTAYAKNFVDHEWYEYNDNTVSKVRDSAKVVTSSAYLLFYRRRSDVPLGGPRFAQILHDYDHPPGEAVETDTESGEDQSLVGNSSLRGSSSALTGAGAVPRQQNRGSGAGVGMMTINPSLLEETHPALIEELPAYESYDKSEETAPLLVDDVEMGVDGLHPSIEEDDDEAIDLQYENSLPRKAGLVNGGWNFANLDSLGQNIRGDQMVSGTGSDIDEVASDVVQHDSSASSGSRENRLADWNDSIAEDDTGNPYIDQSPVPDLVDDDTIAANVALRHDLLESLNDRSKGFRETAFEVKPEEVEEVEEPATEIHIADDEVLKMD